MQGMRSLSIRVVSRIERERRISADFVPLAKRSVRKWHSESSRTVADGIPHLKNTLLLVPLLVAVLAQSKIILVVACRITPLNVRFGEYARGGHCRRNCVRLMAIVTSGNRLGLRRIVRYKPVRNDLLPARRHIGWGLRRQLFKWSVALQAILFGDDRRGRGSLLLRARRGSACFSFGHCECCENEYDRHQEHREAFQQPFNPSFRGSFGPGQTAQHAMSPFPALRSWRLCSPGRLPLPGRAG
jgi:hypothetical protein